MSTKAAAIHAFWSRFGLKAYQDDSVPTGDDAPQFPYLTYTLATDALGVDVALSASLWYRGTSWVAPNAKAEEIAAAIGRGGVLLDCDSGKIWLKRGSPFAQSMGDPEDAMIKRKYLNITAEFLTAD